MSSNGILAVIRGAVLYPYSLHKVDGDFHSSSGCPYGYMSGCQSASRFIPEDGVVVEQVVGPGLLEE